LNLYNTKNMSDKNTKTIDAKGISLGRLASEVAYYLMGKDDPSYQRHNTDASKKVCVFNVDELKLTGNKKDQKVYFRYSGYPGGLKRTPISKVMEEDSREVLKKAIYGMLPKNKLREKMLKNLKMYNKEIE